MPAKAGIQGGVGMTTWMFGATQAKPKHTGRSARPGYRCKRTPPMPRPTPACAGMTTVPNFTRHCFQCGPRAAIQWAVASPRIRKGSRDRCASLRRRILHEYNPGSRMPLSKAKRIERPCLFYLEPCICRHHLPSNSSCSFWPGSLAFMKASPTRKVLTPLLRIRATSSGL